MDPSKAITPKSITTFYNRYRRRKIKPYLKSEAVPESHEGAPFAVDVVGDNFKKVVLNKKTDTFIMYYAPWCGHCKKLKPLWEELADVLQDVPGLVIAKMDATANEVKDLSIGSYPTLKFYPGKEKKGIDPPKDTNRDVDGFIEYLKENTSKNVDWSSFDADDEEDEGDDDLSTGNDDAKEDL